MDEDKLVDDLINTDVVKKKVKVFNKFFRADNVMKVQTEGSGLGLYIARVIIETSGGRMWFSSQENKGTTFSFSLPIHQVK